MQDSLIATIITGGTSGLVAGLLLVIIGLITGKIVPGYVYTAATTELARYREMAFKAMSLAERASSKDGGA